MSQANLNKVVSKLRIPVGPRKKFSNPDGPEGKLLLMRRIVTALIKYERIELNYYVGNESRGYAERLISDAIRYGEHHAETMETASYWMLEKPLVHKLFKVLVPRYKDCPVSYTKMWKAPKSYPGRNVPKCVLELRGNIYPNLVPSVLSNKYLLHNVLLEEARKEYELEKEMEKTEAEMEGNVYDSKCESQVDEVVEDLGNVAVTEKLNDEKR